MNKNLRTAKNCTVIESNVWINPPFGRRKTLRDELNFLANVLRKLRNNDTTTRIDIVWR